MYAIRLLGLALTIAATGGEEITSGDTLVACGAIVRSCQTNCKSNPESFVHWVIEVTTVTCRRYDDIVGLTSLESTSPFLSSFNVSCCPKKEKVVKPTQRANENQPPVAYERDFALVMAKQDRAFILSVTTLGCIVLASFVAMLCVVFYNCKSNSSAAPRNKETKGERTQSTKELEKTSTTVATSDSKSHDTPQKQGQTPPPKYSAAASAASRQQSQASETSDVCRIREEQTPLHLSTPSAVQLPKSFQMHGGFISIPDDEESSSNFFGVGANDSHTVFTDRIIIKSDANYVPELVMSKDDATEGDYVQAPPLKSHRCQKREVPESYNKVARSNNNIHKHTPEDYSKLRRSIGLENVDKKTFVIVECEENKENDHHEVTLNSFDNLND